MPAPAPDTPLPGEAAADEPLGWLEVAWLAALLGVGVVALSSLALAWFDRHSLAGVVVASLVVLVPLVTWVAGRHRVRPEWSTRDLVVAGALTVGAAALFFPGFPYAAKNRDPGSYVHHAVAIADQGTTRPVDPVLESTADITYVEVDGERFPQLDSPEGPLPWRGRAYRAWDLDDEDPTRMNPSFYHLWPSLLATAYDVGGAGALFNVGPLLGVLAVVGTYLAGRRLFGWVAGAVAAGLLMVNMLEVWQVRVPASETLSQLLWIGAVAGVVVAVRTRWWPAAVLAGAAVGTGFVARADGLYPVLLVAAILALLWALDRFDSVARGVLVGLVPTTAVALFGAYDRSARYSGNQGGLLSLPQVLAVLALFVGGALVVRWARGRWPELRDRLAALDGESARRWCGILVAAGLGLFLVFAWFRPELLGEQMRVNKVGERTRGYDELNLQRLTWFVTLPGLLLAWGALVASARRPWPWWRWLVLAPGLAVIPVLVWDPRIAPDLMWWGRRYVPVVLVTLVWLVGAGVVALAGWRPGRRAAIGPALAGVLAVGIGGAMLVQTWPSLDHQEFGGSRAVIDQLDELIPEDDAVLVWETDVRRYPDFGISAMAWHGVPSVTGPETMTEEALAPIAAAFGDVPVYVMTQGELTAEQDAYLDEVRLLGGEIERWDRDKESVPDGAQRFRYRMTLSRYAPS